MKKNKIIKGKIKPKNNYFKYVAMALLVVFAAVGVSQIFGFEINKDTMVCMDKKGNLFVPLDKKGNIDSCGKHDGAVTFNFDGGSEEGGPMTIVPNVLFIDGGFFLMKNGIVKEYMGEVWSPVDSLSLPNDLVLKLVKWNKDWFVDEDGQLYRYTGTGYEMVASPTL